jgi:exosortase/archaeosortase family protein
VVALLSPFELGGVLTNTVDASWQRNSDGVPVFTQSSRIDRNGEKVILISWPCNGLELMALYGWFIIAFPAATKRKLLFMVSGLLLIHFLNLLRCAALVFIALYWDVAFNFAHHYLFTTLVYGVVFFLWMLFADRSILRSIKRATTV